jgi:NAD(P)-dependent dehydrogenase (short-subunit alcohol dehydrogenase family)
MGRATALTFAREGASVAGCDVVVAPASGSALLGRSPRSSDQAA